MENQSGSTKYSLELLSQLSRVLNVPGKSLEDALGEICEILNSHLPIDAVAIWNSGQDAQFMSVLSSNGLSDRFIRYVNMSDRIPRGGGMSGRAIKNRETIVIEDIRTVKDVESSRWIGMLIEEEIVSIIALPIFMHAEVVGTFEIYYKSHHNFTDDEKLFFEVLANQIAVVIANNTQFEVITKNAKKLQEEIENMIHIQKLTQLLNLYLYDSLDIALKSIEEYFRLKYKMRGLAVFRVDEQGRRLDLIASSGLSPYATKFHKIHPMNVDDDSLISLAYREKDPKISNRVLTDERIGKEWGIAMSIEGQIAMGAFPLTVEQRVLGVLVSYYEHIHDFPDEELSVLNTFAQFFAVALEQADTFHRLAGERQRTQSMVDAIEDGLLVFDLSGRIINVNPRILHMLNIQNDAAFIGKYPGELKANTINLIAPIIKLSQLTLSEGETREVEIRDPLNITVLVKEVSLKSDEGEEVGTMRIVHDVTKERTTEILKSNFVATASHQLRTPLTGIKWGLTSLREEFAAQMNDEQKAVLNGVIDANAGVISLVNTLLDSAKIEDSTVELHFEEVDVAELMNKLIDEMRPYADKNSISISCDFHANQHYVVADRERLRIAFENLLDNAVKYTPKGGSVSVTIDEIFPNVSISIADTGIGIPESDAPLLFNKFYRASNAMRIQSSGSGLGLFMVRHIVNRHDGSVTFQSEVGKGTTFVVTLPMSTTPAQ